MEIEQICRSSERRNHVPPVLIYILLFFLEGRGQQKSNKICEKPPALVVHFDRKTPLLYCQVGFSVSFFWGRHRSASGTCRNVHPRKLTCPLKRGDFNRKYISQLPTIDFQGTFVSFSGMYGQPIPGKLPVWVPLLGWGLNWRFPIFEGAGTVYVQLYLLF